ncbi:hypothetical protein F5Y00DRAFT_271476 [Daldinia vernicosa]|uniref:uncharacterized protein n=1 Tax=Daldinia vernicosa TaxID=114800 RepID=UPI0020075B21|nr:uncharacterized protein F5Y00DRAFT_271476 [Daldinia vernicosa]KAI0847009.1 hypothetical protein F5Y00DRAFT_271476 [Daldinia vernicosa]
MASLFFKPDHTFLRHKVDYRMLDPEFVACKSLFCITTDIISRPHFADEKDVNTFSIVISHIRPEMRAEFVIEQVVFRGIMTQLPMLSALVVTWTPAAILFELLCRIVNRPLGLLPNQQPLLTREDILRGLRRAYCLPGVEAQHHEVPFLNFHFHYFASVMYAFDVMDEPLFFVFAMRDALESSWDSASQYDKLFDSVFQWILLSGDRIFQLIKSGFEPPTHKAAYYHGELYQLELYKTYGSHHPAPGLTMHRWEFWKQRIEDTMIFLIDCERPLAVMELENIARETAAHMDLLSTV